LHIIATNLNDLCFIGRTRLCYPSSTRLAHTSRKHCCEFVRRKRWVLIFM